jgi:hypothetical protein
VTTSIMACAQGRFDRISMRRFPKRLHTGTEPITYARLIQCADLSAFGRLLNALVTASTPRSLNFQPEGANP